MGTTPSQPLPLPVLVLATSGPTAEVATLVEGSVWSLAELGAGAARGRDLMRCVANAMRDQDLEPRDLRTIVVDRGPGSFTGVRVGVTAAKTLAYALSIPVRGVVSLEALAARVSSDAEVLAVRDAGRGTWYFARYGPGKGLRPEQVSPRRGDSAAVLAASEGAVLVAEGVERVVERLGFHGSRQEADHPAVGVGAMAAARARAGEAAVPPHELVPLYLQLSTPEERLQSGDAST